MNPHQQLWTSADGWLPAQGAPEWIDELEWIFADNTDVGQVTPGGREHRTNGRVVRPYFGRTFWGGSRFRTTANLERDGHTGPLARNQGGISTSAMRMHGIPNGATGAIVRPDQVRRAVDHLISRLAPSYEAEEGIREWSLAVANISGYLHYGVWFAPAFAGPSPVERSESNKLSVFQTLSEAVDIEFAFEFHPISRDDDQSELCRLWGPDGQWLGEREGAVHLEKFGDLDALRGMAQQQARTAEWRATDALD